MFVFRLGGELATASSEGWLVGGLSGNNFLGRLKRRTCRYVHSRAEPGQYFSTRDAASAVKKDSNKEGFECGECLVLCGAKGSEWKGVDEFGEDDWGGEEGLAGRVHGEAGQAEKEMAEGP